MRDYYFCENCKERWIFYPEDYLDENNFPIRCPLCIMSIWQMIKDTYNAGGIKEVIDHIRLRFFKF